MGKGATGSRLAAMIGTGIIALAMTAAIAAAQNPAPVQLHPTIPLYQQDLSFHDKTPAQKAQILVDREEIRDLVATYAHRAAHGGSMADLYTDDGVFTQRVLPDESIEIVDGITALRSRFGARAGVDVNSPNGARPLPMLHNFLIRVDGDEAQGIVSIEIRVTIGGKSIIGSGYYEDRYRRVDGRWMFARRDVTFIHWVPIQQGWAPPGP